MRTEIYNIVWRGPEVVIYENGWWIERKDYDLTQAEKGKWGLDKDKRTHKLTPYLLPLKGTYDPL